MATTVTGKFSRIAFVEIESTLKVNGKRSSRKSTYAKLYLTDPANSFLVSVASGKTLAKLPKGTLLKVVQKNKQILITEMPG